MDRHVTIGRARVLADGVRWWWHCELCLRDGEPTSLGEAKAGGQVHELYPDGVPELTPETLERWRQGH